MKKLDLKPVRLNGQVDSLVPNLSRRSFFMAAGAAGVSAAALSLGSTRAHAQSTDWTQPGNNNHVLDLQSASEFPGGEVTLDY